MLDAIPGGLAWLGLGWVMLGAYFAPLILVHVVGMLAAYLALRFAIAALVNLAGLRMIRRWQSVDWQARLAHLSACSGSLCVDDIHHVVIIPNYKERFTTLCHTLDHLSRHHDETAAMSVILAIEGSEPDALQKGARLQARYGDRFGNFFVVTHPAGMIGEMQCKSANQSWAARWAKRTLVDGMKYDLDHLIVTTMDADTIWHPAYFACLRFQFAADPARYDTYWQAPIRFHSNVWQINPLMRILHAYSSAWELAYLAASWWQALPMSSYSISMRLLDRAEYWDPNVIADEWHMFIKSFFQKAGNVRLQPVFLPFWANATAGKTLRRALTERYWQTLRHAWGAKEIGYALGQALGTSRTASPPRIRSLGLVLRVAHDNLMAGVGWIILTLGMQLPWLFHPALMRAHLSSRPMVLLQIAVSLMTLLTIVFWIIDLRTRPPRPTPWTPRQIIYELASLPLLALITFSCVTLPVLHAQTRLMLGLPLEFRVTPKK